MKELAPYKEIFAQLVASGKTYAEALRESHPRAKNWKEQTIWVNSSKLMADTKVQLRVREIQEENLKRNQVTIDEVLREMANWLRFDPINLFDDDSCIKPISELTEDVRKSIASMEVVELWDKIDKEKTKIGEIKKVKFIDKRATGDMFMKKFGAYITKLKLDTEDLTHIQEMLDRIDEKSR